MVVEHATLVRGESVECPRPRSCRGSSRSSAVRPAAAASGFTRRREDEVRRRRRARSYRATTSSIVSRSRARDRGSVFGTARGGWSSGGSSGSAETPSRNCSTSVTCVARTKSHAAATPPRCARKAPPPPTVLSHPDEQDQRGDEDHHPAARASGSRRGGPASGCSASSYCIACAASTPNAGAAAPSRSAVPTDEEVQRPTAEARQERGTRRTDASPHSRSRRDPKTASA